MPNSGPESEAVRVRVSSGNPPCRKCPRDHTAGNAQQGDRLPCDCFDSCNRPAESGSVFSRQAEACEEQYTAVGNHKTTLIYTNNFAKSLVHSGLDHLKATTSAALDTGSTVRWSSLALTRSLIEASVECLWLVEPTLDVDTRLRRTNQMLVRAGHEMARMLPDPEDSTPRLVSIDPKARAVSLEVRDAALEWAKAQGWTCHSGRAITRNRWVAEIPGRKELVALAAEGAPTFGQDVYSMLSGATHSQPLLMALAISEDPETLFRRALKFLDIGLSFYTQPACLCRVHGVERSRHSRMVRSSARDAAAPARSGRHVPPGPTHRGRHMRDVSRLRGSLYASPRAGVSHRRPPGAQCGAEAPHSGGSTSKIQLGNRVPRQTGQPPRRGQAQNQYGPGSARTCRHGHTSGLTLLGFDPGELLTSIAASWAVLRAPTYESNAGDVQGWMFRPDEDGPAVPHGNR